MIYFLVLSAADEADIRRHGMDGCDVVEDVVVEAARNGFCKGSSYHAEVNKYIIYSSGALYYKGLV